MAKKTKFKPTWKFKENSYILIPELTITPGYTSPLYVGVIKHYNIYNRSNCRYVCKCLNTGRFQEWDKWHVEKYGKVVDKKTAELLYKEDDG